MVTAWLQACRGDRGHEGCQAHNLEGRKFRSCPRNQLSETKRHAATALRHAATYCARVPSAIALADDRQELVPNRSSARRSFHQGIFCGALTRLRLNPRSMAPGTPGPVRKGAAETPGCHYGQDGRRDRVEHQ